MCESKKIITINFPRLWQWIIDTLRESGGSCDYEKLVEVGEEHHCDTVGAMLKVCHTCGVVDGFVRRARRRGLIRRFWLDFGWLRVRCSTL